MRCAAVFALWIATACGTALSATYDSTNFAASVVSYDPGTNPAVDAYTGIPFTDPTTALGRPTIDTAGDGFNIPISTPVPVVPVYQAFRSYEMVSIGSGGSLVLKFDRPIDHDPANPYGLDFTLFGNSHILSGSNWTNGNPNNTTLINFIAAEPGTVSVSKDGITWFTFTNGPYADSYAPTLGRVYSPQSPDTTLGASNLWWGVPTDPTVPLDPAVTLSSLSGKTVAQAAQAFGNSAGGISFNLSQATNLNWFQYIKITNPQNSGYSTEVDAAAAVSPNQYIGPANGSFNTPANWSFSTTPTTSANFDNAITADTTVTFTSPSTLQRLGIDSTFHYTLTGTAALTLQSTLMVIRGQHTIQSPLHLTAPLNATVFNADATLTVTGPLTVDPGVALTKDGDGTLRLPAAHFAAASIQSGTLALTAGTSRFDSLTLDPAATLDLVSGRLILTNGNLSTVTTLIAASAANQWSGPGITSSTAAADPSHRSLGILSGSAYIALHGATFGDQTITAADTLIMLTCPGDADLSGSITMDDYLALDRGYLMGLTGFANGDFNYDGIINAADYALIDGSASGPLAAEMIALHTQEFGLAYASAIPEPATLTLLLPTLFLLRRRSLLPIHAFQPVAGGTSD